LCFRAELGLVLRALDALGIGLNAEVTESTKSGAKSAVDIDAIVSSARKHKR
jgi:HTH-type transcriptional regulator / antitoxin HipB